MNKKDEGGNISDEEGDEMNQEASEEKEPTGD
jgi:hypothetical protein